jgi:CheY-like chemotaxis protein
MTKKTSKPNVGKLEQKRDIAGLCQAMQPDQDWEVRQAAAEALGRIGDARAIEPLIALLEDREGGVRRVVVNALRHFDTPQARAALHGFHDERCILYIEDEPEIIDLARFILEPKGFEVLGAAGGQEGIEAIRRQRPDLVLLDLMLPVMDGWEVYRQMKADEALQHIPVIVITAKAQSIDKVLGLYIAKVDDYVTKPFEPSKLLESVERVLQKQREWE